MNEQIHIDAWMLGIIGTLFIVLLGVIAVFLKRLLGQFDGVTMQLTTLNDTMGKIDKDLSGRVGILETQTEDLESVWERLRKAESDIIELRVGGCKVAQTCKTQ